MMTVAVSEDQPGASPLQLFQATVAADLRALAGLHHQEVDAPTLDALRAVEFPDNLGLRLPTRKGMDALALMRQAINALPRPIDQTHIDQLAVDYAGIYLTYGYRASPYESVWRDEEQLERQLPMFEVSAFYQRYGLKAANRQTMPDDHISLQLEFIAYLCDRAGNEAGLQAAAKFMDAHLLVWVDEFAHCVAARCETLFYAGLAALTASYADALRDCLARITGQARADLSWAVETKTSPADCSSRLVGNSPEA